MLMGLGSLATIGAEQIRNLAIIVIDNELYSETGMQPTHTSRGVDLAAIAKAAGFGTTGNVSTLSDVKAWIPKLYKTPGPVFLNIKVDASRYSMSIRLRDGTHIKNRFRENLLGSKAFD
jgi:thiamine pyrophosphate-dependent acetolactate synthase large subunit-like protein